MSTQIERLRELVEGCISPIPGLGLGERKEALSLLDQIEGELKTERKRRDRWKDSAYVQCKAKMKFLGERRELVGFLQEAVEWINDDYKGYGSADIFQLDKFIEDTGEKFEQWLTDHKELK